MLRAPIPWAVPHRCARTQEAASGENGVFVAVYPTGKLLRWEQPWGTRVDVASNMGLAGT